MLFLLLGGGGLRCGGERFLGLEARGGRCRWRAPSTRLVPMRSSVEVNGFINRVMTSKDGEQHVKARAASRRTSSSGIRCSQVMTIATIVQDQDGKAR